MTLVRLHEPLGEREAMLPLECGGEGAALALPGLGAAVLRVEARAGRWWAVPQGPDAGVLLNGVPLAAARPLDDGDVLTLGDAQCVLWPAAARIEVAHLAGNATVAPAQGQVLPGEAVVAGVRSVFAARGEANAGNATARLPERRDSRRAWLAGGAVALVLALVAVVLFGFVAVPFSVTPAAASVRAVDAWAWRSGERVFLLPGRRTLEFGHQGYRSERITLDVSRALADAAPLPVQLALLPGRLAIDTGGVAAEVLVDGHPAGNAPGEIAVAAGAREILLRAPRHVDFVTRLEVSGAGRLQTLRAALQPAVGWLVLDTAPAGARVSVDGRFLGMAPQRVELDSGLRQLQIEAPGRRAWRSPVAIVAGQTLDLGRIDLAAPPAAALRVAAAPAAAAAAPDSDTAATGASAPAPATPPAPPPSRLHSALAGNLLWLPPGRYVQGSERREQGRRANEVQREVTLTRGFYLAETEVTNAQFRAFRPAHAAGIALDRTLELDTQAVTGVSWNDAVEFCNWLSLREGLPAAYERRDGRWQRVEPRNTGYRLPTEAEWEYAARRTGDGRWLRYAWGDTLPPPPGAANLAGQESLPTKPGPDVRLAAALPAYRDEHAVVAPVGSYARSAGGFHDLGGNVSEWMHDVYLSLPEPGAVTDPQGDTRDGAHAIRGASWRTAAIAELRLAWRERAAGPAPTIGFRVARDAPVAP